MAKAIPFPAGTKFGRLELVQDRDPKSRRVSVRCECGTEKTADIHNLRYGKEKSCGCLLRENASERHTTHGLSWNARKIGHPLYATWVGMKQRCENPNNKVYPRYGGRGIKVCPRWRDSFTQFLADMGPRPPGHTMDRINNDGDYEPANCQWATRRMQTMNQGRSIAARGPCAACGTDDPKGSWRKGLCSPCYMARWTAARGGQR